MYHTDKYTRVLNSFSLVFTCGTGSCRCCCLRTNVTISLVFCYCLTFKMSNDKTFTYFNLRGRGEPIRLGDNIITCVGVVVICY